RPPALAEKAERRPNYRDRVDALPVPVRTPGLEQCDEVDTHPLDQQIIGNQHPGDRREDIPQDPDVSRVAARNVWDRGEDYAEYADDQRGPEPAKPFVNVRERQSARIEIENI